MTYIIFRVLCNFFDLCCINLCKAAKHWDSFLSDCISQPISSNKQSSVSSPWPVPELIPVHEWAYARLSRGPVTVNLSDSDCFRCCAACTGLRGFDLLLLGRLWELTAAMPPEDLETQSTALSTYLCWLFLKGYTPLEIYLWFIGTRFLGRLLHRTYFLL